MAKTTVLGIGNILLQDEGVGVRAAEELLRRFRFGDDVQVLDGGTLGMDLLRFLHGTERLLILDAAAGGGKPGTRYHFAGSEVKAYFEDKVSLHELGIKDVLGVLEITEHPVKETVILGVEPASLELGLELTPVVAGQLDGLVEDALAVLREWETEVTEIV